VGAASRLGALHRGEGRLWWTRVCLWTRGFRTRARQLAAAPAHLSPLKPLPFGLAQPLTSLSPPLAPLCAPRSEPYDPYVPGGNPNMPGGGPGPSGSTGGGKNNKTAQIQQQIDDTVGIMRENITKVAERGERLDALQDKTGALARSSSSSSLVEQD